MPQLTRRQCYILAQQRKLAQRPVACDVSPLVGTIGHAIKHPIDTIRDPSRLRKEYGRRAGNIYRKSEDLPQVQENNMISIKDIIKHHKTHEDVHRSGYEKFAKSEFHNVKPIAEKHKRLWHHHAGVRTRYEAMDRAGKTHVSQRQYERDSKGRFASFSLSLVDNVVLARPAGYALAARPDRFAKARAVKRQRQVLPRAHYVIPAGNAAAFKFEVEDRFKFINDTSGGSPHKVSLTMQHYPNPDPEDRRQWVLVNVETDDVALLHQIDTLAKKWKSRSLNSRGDMSPLEPTARVRKPGTVEAQETTVFTLPEKRGIKFSRDVKKFNGTRTGIKKIVGQNRVVVVVMCPDPATLKLVKQWAASEWGAHEVGMNTFNQAQEMSFAMSVGGFNRQYAITPEQAVKIFGPDANWHSEEQRFLKHPEYARQHSELNAINERHKAAAKTRRMKKRTRSEMQEYLPRKQALDALHRELRSTGWDESKHPRSHGKFVSFAHELRHHYAMGVAGRIAGGLIGGNIGGVIGTIGGPLGVLAGTAVGAYAGQSIGHRLQEGEKEPMGEKGSVDTSKLHAEERKRYRKRKSAGDDYVKNEKPDKGALGRGLFGAHAQPKTKEGHEHQAIWHRWQAAEHRATPIAGLGNLAKEHDLHAAHHEKIAAEWDESKHPRSHGKFV